jgi:hypothetical protein
MLIAREDEEMATLAARLLHGNRHTYMHTYIYIHIHTHQNMSMLIAREDEEMATLVARLLHGNKASELQGTVRKALREGRDTHGEQIS